MNQKGRPYINTVPEICGAGGGGGEPQRETLHQNGSRFVVVVLVVMLVLVLILALVLVLVLALALALVLAAFLGAALGLVWQSASFFDGDDQDVADTEDASADDSAPVGPTVPASG